MLLVFSNPTSDWSNWFRGYYEWCISMGVIDDSEGLIGWSCIFFALRMLELLLEVHTRWSVLFFAVLWLYGWTYKYLYNFPQKTTLLISAYGQHKRQRRTDNILVKRAKDKLKGSNIAKTLRDNNHCTKLHHIRQYIYEIRNKRDE